MLRQEKGKGEGGAGAAEEAKGVSESSEESKKEKKKKKKKPFRMTAKKDYNALFQGSGLDKDAKVRRKVARIARRAMRKRSRGSSSSASSEDSSEEKEAIQEELFEDSRKSYLAARAAPGALSAHSLKQMSKQLLLEMGELAEGEVQVNAIALRFYRTILKDKMSAVMGREALTLASIVDNLLTGQAALAVDTALQRLKSLEAISSGASWQVAQRYEVVPSDMGQMASQAEASAAARENREEARSRNLQKGWDRDWRPKGESKSKGDNKNKGKEKGREKGRGKGGRRDQQREDKDK